MLNEGVLQTNLSGDSLKQNLSMAQQFHENYILKSSPRDLKEAIDYYVRIIKMDPQIAEPYYKLASLLWEKGEIDALSAIEQCDYAIELDPKSSSAHLYKGYFENTAKLYDRSELSFNKSIQLSGFFSARPRLALAMTVMQKMQNSSVTLVDSLRWVYYFFTGISLLLCDYHSLRMCARGIKEDFSVLKYRVKGMFYERVKKYDNAIETYEVALENTGKSEVFYSKIADVSIEKNNPYQAIKSYKDAIKECPQNSLLWAKLATTLQKYYTDEVDEIADCYEQLSILEPDNSRIYYELGHLYVKLDDKVSAINAFKKAIELEPNNPFYRNSLAYALIQVQEYDAAIEEYQTAIKLNPDDEWTSVVSQALGSIYHQVKENIDAAILAYQTSIVLDRNNADAFVSLAEAYQDKGDLNGAITNYCEAVKISPQDAKVYTNMASVLWEQNFVDEAVIAYNKSIELDGTSEVPYNNLGVIYLEEMDLPVKALEYFERAIEINPNYTHGYYNKGRACEQVQDKTQAAEAYQMAYDLNRITNEIEDFDVEQRLYNLFST